MTESSPPTADAAKPKRTFWRTIVRGLGWSWTRSRAGVALFFMHTRMLCSRQTLGMVLAGGIGLGVAGIRAEISSPADCLFWLHILLTGLFILLSMGLVTRDRDDATIEMLFVSTRGFYRLILFKFLPVAVWTLVFGIVAALVLDRRAGGFAWSRALFFSYTTGLAAGLGALYLSVLFRNAYIAGAATLVLAFGIFSYFGGPRAHIALFDPFLQLFPPQGDLDRSGLMFWNRFYVLVLAGVLFDQTVRRVRRIELWVK